MVHTIKDKSRLFYIILTGLLSVLFGAVYYFTPLCIDDIWFLENSKGNPGSWEYFITTVQNCAFHWQYDCGRLSNMAATPFLALLPRWVYATVSALAVWIIYLGGPAVAKTKYISYGAAFWVLTTTFIFPWFDFMFTIMFTVNYVWPCALLMIFLYFLRKTEDGKSYSFSFNIFLFLLSFILGWWHEGLSAPLAAALIIYFAVLHKRHAKSQLYMLTGFAGGAITILMMPAFWRSIGDRHSILFKPVLWETLLGFVFIALFFVFIALFLYSLCKKQFRLELKTHKKRILATCSAVFAFGLFGTAIFVKYFPGPRAGSFMQIISALGILYLLRLNETPKFINKAFLRNIVMILVFVASIINMTASVYMQRKLSGEYKEVKSLADNLGGDGYNVVFYDKTPILLWIDLYKPTYKALNTPYGLSYVRKAGISILPQVLKNLSSNSEELKKCTGENLFLYKNQLLVKGKQPDTQQTAILKSEDGKTYESRTFYHEFLDKDGQVWTQIQTASQTINADLVIADAYWGNVY